MKTKLTYKTSYSFYFGVGLGFRTDRGINYESIFILLPFFVLEITEYKK